MSQFERVYKIDRLLRNRIPPSKQKLLAALDVSEPTLKRDLEYMRSRLGAPITWDRQTGGYGYAADQPEFTIPGLWFSADEIHALLLIIHIVDQIQPSFLGDQMKPFRDRLGALRADFPASTDARGRHSDYQPGVFGQRGPRHACPPKTEYRLSEPIAVSRN